MGRIGRIALRSLIGRCRLSLHRHLSPALHLSLIGHLSPRMRPTIRAAITALRLWGHNLLLRRHGLLLRGHRPGLPHLAALPHMPWRLRAGTTRRSRPGLSVRCHLKSRPHLVAGSHVIARRRTRGRHRYRRLPPTGGPIGGLHAATRGLGPAIGRHPHRRPRLALWPSLPWHGLPLCHPWPSHPGRSPLTGALRGRGRLRRRRPVRALRPVLLLLLGKRIEELGAGRGGKRQQAKCCDGTGGKQPERLHLGHFAHRIFFAGIDLQDTVKEPRPLHGARGKMRCEHYTDTMAKYQSARMGGALFPPFIRRCRPITTFQRRIFMEMAQRHCNHRLPRA